MGQGINMKLIHIIHSFTKLLTLKRSRFFTNFTLKRSRFYAETLPHSIYTYIYLYKKPVVMGYFCGWIANEPLYLVKTATHNRSRFYA